MGNDKTQVNIYPSNELLTKINNYIFLMNEDKPSNERKLNRSDFILDLVEKELQGLVLDNTEIKLEEPFYFNLKELLENGTVKASKTNPIHEREEIQIVKSVPNNLDTFNREYRTFCSENKASLHIGLTVITELNSEDATKLEDGLKDTIYIYSYDSQEDTLEITIGNDINMYFKVEQEDLKEQILEKNKTIHLLYKCCFYDMDGNKREEINEHYLRVMLGKIKEQRTYFTSFKNMKEFKESFIDSFSDKDGVINNPVVKHLLDQLKEF
jgi:hypothetical protein